MSNSVQLADDSAAKQELMPVPLVALQRAASLAIDFVLVGTLALTPMIFHHSAIELPNIGYNSATFEVIAKANGASLIGMLMALTPLPIIYLRLIFKRVMKSPTPGEAIVGITSYSTTPGLEGAIQEILYALAQYFVNAFALIFGCLASFLSTLLPLGLLEQYIPGYALKNIPEPILVTLAVLVYAFFYVGAIGVAFMPHSRTDLGSYFDNGCQMVVKRLRISKG